MQSKDYYKILGVEETADIKKIKESYRELAFKYHPDRNKDDTDSADKMKLINEAYAVLSNSGKKAEYDQMRSRFGDFAYDRFRTSYSDNDIFSGSDVNQIFEEMARSFGLRGFDSIFKDFYGSGYKTFEFKQHGARGKGYVFRGGFGPFGKKGGKRTLFGGLGRLSKMLLQQMGGAVLPVRGDDTFDQIKMYPDFAGTGGPYPYLHKKRSKKLVLTIPAGVRDGQQIRLSGMGETGKGGAPDGDLYLKVIYRKKAVQKIKDFIVSIVNKK